MFYHDIDDDEDWKIERKLHTNLAALDGLNKLPTAMMNQVDWHQSDFRRESPTLFVWDAFNGKTHATRTHRFGSFPSRTPVSVQQHHQNSMPPSIDDDQFLLWKQTKIDILWGGWRHYEKLWDIFRVLSVQWKTSRNRFGSNFTAMCQIALTCRYIIKPLDHHEGGEEERESENQTYQLALHIRPRLLLIDHSSKISEISYTLMKSRNSRNFHPRQKSLLKSISLSFLKYLLSLLKERENTRV